MTKRTDGGSLAKALHHYWVKPWTEPLSFWRNEALHGLQILADPLGHSAGHLNASADALKQGRPIDAGVALVNDMWESSDHQSPSAKKIYGIEQQSDVPAVGRTKSKASPKRLKLT